MPKGIPTGWAAAQAGGVSEARWGGLLASSCLCCSSDFCTEKQPEQQQPVTAVEQCPCHSAKERGDRFSGVEPGSWVLEKERRAGPNAWSFHQEHSGSFHPVSQTEIKARQVGASCVWTLQTWGIKNLARRCRKNQKSPLSNNSIEPLCYQMICGEVDYIQAEFGINLKQVLWLKHPWTQDKEISIPWICSVNQMQLFEIYSFCRNQDDIFWDSPDISGCLDFLGLALLVPLLLKKNKIKKSRTFLTSSLGTTYNKQTNKQTVSIWKKNLAKKILLGKKKRGFSHRY